MHLCVFSTLQQTIIQTSNRMLPTILKKKRKNYFLLLLFTLDAKSRVLPLTKIKEVCESEVRTGSSTGMRKPLRGNDDE